MELLGVDVGFSRKRKTTGVACLSGVVLTTHRVGSSWESRRESVPAGFRPDFIAFDGPLLPTQSDVPTARFCERVFCRSTFSNRCKPGRSDFGLGLRLRTATAEACKHFGHLLKPGAEDFSSLICFDGPIAEAFPNAFLGVLLPEETFVSRPKLKRGKKFDWLYQNALENGRLDATFFKCLELPGVVWTTLKSEHDHERRAALICLLTAALAAYQSGERIGDPIGGWFWLPPFNLWQDWAKRAHEAAVRELSLTASC